MRTNLQAKKVSREATVVVPDVNGEPNERDLR